MPAMSLPRALSRSICRVLIGVFLFAQLAVAGYACPGLGQGTSQAAEARAMPAGCDQMDRDTANLCAEHCHFGQQSSDTAPMPVAIAPLPAQGPAATAERGLAVAAGHPPDPVLTAGINTLPINGPDRLSVTSDFMTMRAIGLMQEFTRADKRKARAARFEQEAQAAEAS